MFYIEVSFLLVTNFVLWGFLFAGDDHAAWAAPAMVAVARLASFLLDRALDRPTFELLGCTLNQQGRSFVLTTNRNKNA